MRIDRFSAGMLLGAALIFAGVLLTQAGYDAFFLVAGGVAALATTAVRRWQRGNEPEKDEEDEKTFDKKSESKNKPVIQPVKFQTFDENEEENQAKFKSNYGAKAPQTPFANFVANC